MGFEYDDSKWPIASVRWTGTLTDRELAEGLAWVDRCVARGERFGILIDGRGAGGMSPEQRNRVIAHMKDRAELNARYLVQAVVMDNLIQRTLYYGIHLLFPSPYPSKVFAQVTTAEAWLISIVGAPRSQQPSTGQPAPGAAANEG